MHTSSLSLFPLWFIFDHFVLIFPSENSVPFGGHFYGVKHHAIY